MKTCLSFSIPLFLIAVMLLSLPEKNFGQGPDLRTVSSFVFFSAIGAVENTGISQVVGAVGTDNGAITGFDPANNIIHNANAVTAQGLLDLQLASTQIDNTTTTSALASLLGNGQILTAGIYSVSEASSVNADLTLDAQGDASAVFIFKITGALSTTTSARMYLINGASAINVFWKATGAISMAAGANMKGNFIANDGAFSMAAGCILEGRGLSTTGAISINEIIAYTPDIALPVTLIEFKATKVDHSIKLFWKVADEDFLAMYEPERSLDARHFYKIGSVNSENTPFLKTYNWSDNAPLHGVNFYRLKMIDINGVYKFSSILKVYTDTRKSISVYPNPVINHILLLEMYDQLKGDYIINLYTSNYSKVLSTQIKHTGFDAVSSINLDKNLAKGIYFLKISDPEKKQTTLKIIID